MSDNLRRYRAIHNALTQAYPAQPTGNVARHLHTLAMLISGIVGSKSTQLPAIPADHLRVLCDYGIRQRSQHFDHPFLSLEETSAIRYHRRSCGKPTHLVISA